MFDVLIPPLGSGYVPKGGFAEVSPGLDRLSQMHHRGSLAAPGPYPVQVDFTPMQWI
jgi:hypothetical protein